MNDTIPSVPITITDSFRYGYCGSCEKLQKLYKVINMTTREEICVTCKRCEGFVKQ